MEEKINNLLAWIHYSFIFFIFLMLSITNINLFIAIMVGFFIVCCNFTLRSFFFRNSNNKLYCISYLIDITTIISITLYTNNLYVLLLLMLPLNHIVENNSMKISIVYSIILYGCNFLIVFKERLDYKSLIFLTIITPIYVTLYIMFYLIKTLIKQNRITDNVLKEVTMRKLEKDNLYEDLKEAYLKVESATALKERNRIAAEIHDTVGHTLTTVLVEMEAAKRLLNKDLDLAKEKLNLAQGQVRYGLNNIRSSVRILEAGKDIMDFYKSINSIISDTELHSAVKINKEIEENIDIPLDKRNIITSILMEGLANSIRHGNATEFNVRLLQGDKKLIFELQDNGMGSKVIVPGFGLRSINNRVKEAKGLFNYYSTEEGFCLYIEF